MRHVPLIPANELPTKTKQIEGWELEGKGIIKLFHFESFKLALEFANKVGELAELADHHPAMNIDYRNVTLRLTSHMAGGLTDLDFSLAKEINEI
tara:strand:- start:175 stop:459 length:285 start_codon:yes stop_codon:yes gene_type:complete